jgi:hypothetical protein
VRGFGAVHTDVDTNHTAVEYFDKERACVARRGEAISQEIPYENAVRDCFVGISTLRVSTLLAMTEKYF